MSEQQTAARKGSDTTGGHSHSGEQTNPGAEPQLPYNGSGTGSVSQNSHRGGTVATGRAQEDALLGTIIDGRYRVEAVLGEGGMGVVYRCRHQIIDKLVAMKVLHADLARDEEVTTRFLNEAKAASAIGNPHIIDISDFGRLPDGSTYFIMEFLDGRPLAAVTEQGQPVSVKRILHIAFQLVEGLAAAHRAGIVHRDLKPDNIFLISRGSERDFVKILDFGIAKVPTAGQTSKLTRAGAVFGTPHYMSPEQAAGAPVDQRVDIYSLGVILYELASGRVPFDADNFMGILTQHMYKAPVPIRALVPEPQEVPPGLEAIVLKCLSKRPEQRYGSMEELLDDLTKLQEGTVPDAVSELMQRSQGFNVPADYMKSSPVMPVPVPATPNQGRGRLSLYAGLAGVGAAVTLVIAVFALSSQTTAAPTPTVEPPVPVPTSPVPASPPPPATEPAVTVQQPVAPAPINVVLGVEPPDAHVFRGGEDLGTGPVLVPVQSGSPVELEVRREGYLSESLVLDGTVLKKLVSLTPRGGRGRRPPGTSRRDSTQGTGQASQTTQTQQSGSTSTSSGRPRTRPSTGDIVVDPWGGG